MKITPAMQAVINEMKNGNVLVLTAAGTSYNNTLHAELRTSNSKSIIGMDTIRTVRYNIFEKLENAGIIYCVKQDIQSGDFVYRLTEQK